MRVSKINCCNHIIAEFFCFALESVIFNGVWDMCLKKFY